SAAHCVEALDPGVVEYAFFGQVVPNAIDGRFMDLAGGHRHPNWNPNDTNTDDDDISLFQLAHPATNLPIIPLFEVTPTVGASIRHVGFGATTGAMVENDGAGTKREVTTALRTVAGQIESNGPGRGHCFGDSGGPG